MTSETPGYNCRLPEICFWLQVLWFKSCLFLRISGVCVPLQYWSKIWNSFDAKCWFRISDICLKKWFYSFSFLPELLWMDDSTVFIGVQAFRQHVAPPKMASKNLTQCTPVSVDQQKGRPSSVGQTSDRCLEVPWNRTNLMRIESFSMFCSFFKCKKYRKFNFVNKLKTFADLKLRSTKCGNQKMYQGFLWTV